MHDERIIDLRRTQLLAVDSNLDDARRALLRAARIPTVFAAELRTILAAVAELEQRVLASEVEYALTIPGSGGETEVYFSDLSEDYVRFNSEYTS